MKHCVICSRPLKADGFDDPLNEVEGKICYRCLLIKAQKGGNLKLRWSIGSKTKSNEERANGNDAELLYYHAIDIATANHSDLENAIELAKRIPDKLQAFREKVLKILNDGQDKEN